MKYYTDTVNVWCFEEDGSQDSLITMAMRQMTPAEISAHLAPPPAPQVQVVTMRQARLALHRRGLLPSVEAALASLPEPQKTEAQIEWEYSQTVDLNKEYVQLIGQALNLDLNEIFTFANTL